MIHVKYNTVYNFMQNRVEYNMQAIHLAWKYPQTFLNLETRL